MTCPRCGEELTQEMVDVGVGEIPCGPLGCENCGYVEPDALADVDLTDPSAPPERPR